MNEIKELKLDLIETIVKSDDDNFIDILNHWFDQHSIVLNHSLEKPKPNHVDYINDIIAKVGDKYKGVDADIVINDIRGNYIQ